MSVPPKVGIRFAKILIKKRKVKDKSLFFHFTSSFVGIFHIPKRDYPIIPTYKTHFFTNFASQTNAATQQHSRQYISIVCHCVARVTVQ